MVVLGLSDHRVRHLLDLPNLEAGCIDSLPSVHIGSNSVALA